MIVIKFKDLDPEEQKLFVTIYKINFVDITDESLHDETLDTLIEYLESHLFELEERNRAIVKELQFGNVLIMTINTLINKLNQRR